MKIYYGYLTQTGYRGLVVKENRWMFFPTEQEYIDYVDELEEEDE